MASLHKDRNAFSTLEWVWDTGTARAPEPLVASILAGSDSGLEVDTSNSGPEVLPGTSAEVSYNTVPPEVVNCSDRIAGPDSSIASRFPLKVWRTRVVVTLVILVMAALAIGLGVGLRKRPVETSPPTPQKPLNSSVTQTILNDTSLAAAGLTNGDRHLFFQGAEGSLRRIVHTAATSQWILDKTPILVSGARDLTPMTVHVQGAEAEVQIILYYISTEDQLSESGLVLSRNWTGRSLNYTAAQTTRQLSLMFAANADEPTNKSVVTGLLLYENPAGNVTALLAAWQRCASGAIYCVAKDGEVYPAGSWLDISKNYKSVPQSVFSPQYYNYSGPNSDSVTVVSSTLYESSPGTIFSTPFSIAFNSSDQMDVLICAGNSQPTAKVDNPGCNSLMNTIYNPWTNSSHGAFFTEAGNPQQYQASNLSGIKDSDLVLIGTPQFALWVRGTEPVVSNHDGSQVPAPNVSFPFKRLAGITSEDGTASFLYHQINGTTFAEEQYDATSNEWLLSSYITVPELT
ncbi:hypothetical protein BDR22DRAFT_970096 [Usnea florida]